MSPSAPTPTPAATRVLLSGNPYAALDAGRDWLTRGRWPCCWISLPGSAVTAYRLAFAVEKAETVRLHVAADERYELFLDGVRIGRGSERGDPANWFFDSYDLALAPGRHLLAARVWALGPVGPRSQMSVRPGFLLAPQEEPWIALLGTGLAAWEARALPGYSFAAPFDHPYYSIGHNVTLDGGAFPWDWESGGASGWQAPEKGPFGSDAVERTRVGGEHLLRPAILPPPLSREWTGGRVRSVSPLAAGAEAGDCKTVPIREGETEPGTLAAWEAFWKSGAPLTVAPGQAWRVVVDMEAYLCSYQSVVVSGGRGGSVRLHWAESLFNEPEAKTKGRRDAVDGKYFVGVGDAFLPDGGGAEERRFEPPFWRAGRYLEIVARAGSEPLTLHRIAPTRTGYPFEMEGKLETGDPRWDRFAERADATMRASSHDGYCDPYYEQMMWAGDGVQNILTTFVLTRDDRLARKLLRAFDASRLPSGLTRARHPAKDALLIAPYSLYWVQMIREFAFWRGDAGFVRELMPGARGALDAFEGFLDADGLLQAPPGWNFIDWVPPWGQWGMPAEANRGISAILHWHLVLAYSQFAELEEGLGEPERAARCRRRAAALAASGLRAFWCEGPGLLAESPAKTHFSEHAQTYALLSGQLPPDKADRLRQGLRARAGEGTELIRATISFSHYLFDAYRQAGSIGTLFERMELWFGLEDLGFLTLPEGPEPSRSDCHSWSTHPLYHGFASILGIRPAAFGFKRVTITPQLGPLRAVSGRLPHPDGLLSVALRRDGGTLRGEVVLPADVSGTFHGGGSSAWIPLQPGRQEIACPYPESPA